MQRKALRPLLLSEDAAFVQMRIVPDGVDVRFGKSRMSGLHGTCVALYGLGGVEEKLQVAL